MLKASSIVHSHGLLRRTPFALTPIFLALSLALSGGASAAAPLPSGGHFVAGTGSISGNATSLTINQASNRGVIDWNSFSIGSGKHVSINNGSGATLNRVTGGSPSSILGSLSGTGSVYLINRQGIVVGSSGVISTGGNFVASTLDTDNASFMNHRVPLTFAGSSSANVVNLGRIGSSRGSVFLLATGEVENLGSIHAANGTAELAAGKNILLHDSSTGRQVFVLVGKAGTVLNEGEIEAAQISLQAADGNVFALSGTHVALRATGTAKRDGHIWLVANGGTVKISSDITAQNANRSGGTVDTTAQQVSFCQCGPTIRAGVWNITVPTFTVRNPEAWAIMRSLNAGTSVNVDTVGGSASSGSGDIDVMSRLGWIGSASLNLNAYGSVITYARITNVGAGNLTMRADSTAIDNNGSVSNGGTDWSRSTGIVRMFYDSPATFYPGTQFKNPAWVPVPYGPVRAQFTAYQLVNNLSELQAINNNLSGNYALGRDIDAIATRGGGFVPIGNGATTFSGLFDGMGHQITSLTLTQTVLSGPPNGDQYPVQGLFGVIGNSALVRDVAVNGTGHVSSNGSARGYGILAGDNYGTIENASSSGSIVAPKTRVDIVGAAGGLVGENYGNVARSSSSVNVDVGIMWGGGLVGRNDYGGVISQSFATGAVDGAGLVGGLVGDNTGNIIQSYASGPVHATSNEVVAGDAAGLVAWNSGLISQSYATGSVRMDGGERPWEEVGGLVGTDFLGVIRQSFATGPVTLSNPGLLSFSGGIVGHFGYGEISNDVYWNVQTTGVPVGIGYIDGPGPVPPQTNGLTTAKMSKPSSFVGYHFGPGGVWAMPTGSTHPVLAWQVTPWH